VAIASSIADSVVEGFHDVLWGYEAGADPQQHGITHDSFISLLPNEVGLYTDSVFNTKTGRWMPLQYREVVLHTKDSPVPVGKEVLLIITVFIMGFTSLFQIVVFCMLIYAINKSRIFVWENVFKLQLIGGAMIITFIVNALYKYIYHSSYVAHISIPDYTINASGMWDFQQLIPGLGVLLMAEIFAVGLRLREDQELTI